MKPSNRQGRPGKRLGPKKLGKGKINIFLCKGEAQSSQKKRDKEEEE